LNVDCDDVTGFLARRAVIFAIAWLLGKIRIIYSARFKRRKVGKKQAYTKTEAYKALTWNVLNILAKCHQNRSL